MKSKEKAHLLDFILVKEKSPHFPKTTHFPLSILLQQY